MKNRPKQAPKKKAGAGLKGLTPHLTLVDQAVVGAFEALPEKKQIFIRELHKNGWNKTQAGLKAGCKSPEAALATGNNWLKERNVQQAIQEFQDKDNKSHTLNVDDLKAELWKNHLRADRVSDSNKALELILRLLGAFKDSLDIKQQVGIAQVLSDLTTATHAVGKEEDKESAISAFSSSNNEDLPDKEQLSSDNLESTKDSSDNGGNKNEL